MSTSPANYCLPTQHRFLSAPVKCFGQRKKKGLPTPKLNSLKNNKLMCGTSSIKKLRGRLLIIINEAGGLINRLLNGSALFIAEQDSESVPPSNFMVPLEK